MNTRTYFLKLTLIYAALCGIFWGISTISEDLPDLANRILIPPLIATTLFFPPFAIGLFHNRLFEMGRWLASSLFSATAGLFFTIMWCISNPQDYLVLTFVILGGIASIITMMISIISASCEERANKFARFFGKVTKNSLIFPIFGCILYSVDLSRLGADILLGSLFLTIGSLAATLLMSVYWGLEETPPITTAVSYK